MNLLFVILFPLSLYLSPSLPFPLSDHKDDRRSLERKLPESMYLIVKRNREEQSWQFPQGRLLDSESSLRAVRSTPSTVSQSDPCVTV